MNSEFNNILKSYKSSLNGGALKEAREEAEKKKQEQKIKAVVGHMQNGDEVMQAKIRELQELRKREKQMKKEIKELDEALKRRDKIEEEGLSALKPMLNIVYGERVGERQFVLLENM